MKKSFTVVTTFLGFNSLLCFRVRPCGLMLSCTCSGAVTQSKGAFIDMLKKSAEKAGRRSTYVSLSFSFGEDDTTVQHNRITVIENRHAARDHMVRLAYPEGLYLTAVLMIVH